MSRAEGLSTAGSDGMERSALQQIQRRFDLLLFRLPLGEPFLVLFQNVRRGILNEVRIVEFRLHLLDFGIEKVKSKLNNSDFVQNAPPNVLEEHKKRLAEWQAKQQQVKSALDLLQG